MEINTLPQDKRYNQDLYGSKSDIYKKSYVKFLTICSVLFLSLLLVLFIVGLFLIGNGYFKSEVSQVVNPLFNASVVTLNDYQFNPNTVNDFNNDFNNKVNITNNFNFNINCEVAP